MNDRRESCGPQPHKPLQISRDGGILAAISRHRLATRELINFTRECDCNRRTDSFSAAHAERLSRYEQNALTEVAESPVLSAADRRAKAVYLAALLEADAECMKPADLVAALRSLA